MSENLNNRLIVASEFSRFIRIETCLFISGITISGYMMTNPIDPRILIIFLSAFFSAAIGYAYNHVTDKKEDAINNKRINMFAAGRAGMIIIALFVSMVLAFSTFLSSCILFILAIPVIFAYSKLRVKKVFMLKNVYTGATICMMFVIGALSGTIFSEYIMLYAPAIFMTGFLLNLLGDIRGVDGDSSSGVRTIPTVFGIRASKIAVYLIIGLFITYLFAFSLHFMYPLIVFMLAVAFFIHTGIQKGARFSLLISFCLFPFVVLAFNVGGL